MKFPGTEDELAELGERVAVLQGGVGFGELSILSSTHKLRTASAVGMTDEDLVFMMYEKTYNEGKLVTFIMSIFPSDVEHLNFIRS